MDVSIIIVNYNTRELLSDCIKSICSNTVDVQYEVIVSDNGSTDGSVEMLRAEYPQVIIIENKRNIGFGAANNRALDHAKGKYVFFLNSDTILLNNAVKYFKDYWEKNEAANLGCLGAQLQDQNGYFIHSYDKYPSPISVLKALLHMCLWSVTHKNINQTSHNQKKLEVPKTIDGYITGADMFVRNDEAAYFDERYFMYAEETDLQYNHFYKLGKKCIIIPEPEIVHLVGASDTTGTTERYDFMRNSNRWMWISYLKYFEKNVKRNDICVKIIRCLLGNIYKGKLEYFVE